MEGEGLAIRKDTYGLILISNNCYSMLENDNLKNLKDSLEEENQEENVDFVNSWSLFGVHDTAILVRSSGRLDKAVNKIGGWVAGLNEGNISIKGHIYSGFDNSIKDQCADLAKLYLKPDINKVFKIYEYRVDPLIPIYVDENSLRSNDGVFLVMYIKFDLSSVYEMLKEENGSMEKFYTPFMDKNIIAIFHGFSLFDLVIVAKCLDYCLIRKAIIEIRKKSKLIINETYSLISMNNELKDLGYTSLDCCMLVKVKAGAEDQTIWDGIKNLATKVKLEGLCIRKLTNPGEHAGCPPYISFRAGFFDLAIDLGFKDIRMLQNFIHILDSMPFIEDTSTSISFDTTEPNKKL